MEYLKDAKSNFNRTEVNYCIISSSSSSSLPLTVNI